MAGHEWEDWFEREEFIGQISDIRVQNLQVEREMVQKRTFTRWMNLHLEKCNPPMEVHDLFRDIQDGKILMALLEELSGCRLLHAFKPSAHRIFRLNNIAKVLTFLEERNVKLVSIDAADIADGNSSIVLGLIWNIILFFQIKELTGNIRNQFPSSSSLSSIPTSSDSDTSHSSTPSDERRPSIAARDHGKAIKTLLHWVQRRTRKYGVAIQDFGKSWTSGLAFLAVIKSIDPSLVDMRRALLRSSRENIEEAFRTAHYSLGIPRLLEPEDVTLNPPDEQSIMTYVSQFLEHFPGIEEEDHSDFLERSKVSARMNEPPVRNGVQKKREKSYVVKRDWVQPPPKIFISSVIEGHAKSHSPAQPRTPEDRPWASEDSSVASSPSTAESRPLCRPLGLNKDTSSISSSPQPSLIDSALESPDSWGEMPSETAPPVQQSSSIGSLSDLQYSTTTGDLTPDNESSMLPESVSQDQVDPDLFIDEGNFSLSSMESLQTKSVLLSEEEDAYRYILELKEEGSASHMSGEDTLYDSHAQQAETSPVQDPDVFKTDSQEPSYGESDSGYYPGHKDITITESEDVSKGFRLPDANEPVPVEEHQVELCKENLESFTSDDSKIIPAESNPMSFFEDDAECPVLKYERISISESEEDLELEPSEVEENDMPEVFSSDRASEDRSTHEVEHSCHREAEEVDQASHLDHDPVEPAVEPEENNTEPEDKADQVWAGTPTNSIPSGAAPAEIQREVGWKTSGNGDSGMCEEPVMKDLSEATAQPANSLADLNFVEVAKVEETNYKLEFGASNHLGKIEEVSEKVACNEEASHQGMISPQGAAVTEANLKVGMIGDTGCPENEPSGIESTVERATVGESTLESQHNEMGDVKEACDDDKDGLEVQQVKLRVSESGNTTEHKTFVQDHETKLEGPQSEVDGLKEEEAPYNHHAIHFEDTEPKEGNHGMQKSEIPQNDVPVSDIDEVAKELNADHIFCEENEHSLSPPTPSSPASQPDWDVAKQLGDGQSQGQATWEEITGAPERAERYPAELRLSLSVTPLQPAPSQLSNTDSNRERAMLEKIGEGSVESPEQSPFELWSRHPGEWGAVDSDLNTDHCELISSDEELSASAAAMATATSASENMEELREEAANHGAEDETQPLTAPCLQEAPVQKESKMENGEKTDAITTENAKQRKESPAGSPESEVTLPEIYLLLLMWLLLYCLLVLPQIDIWTLPSLLLNLDE